MPKSNVSSIQDPETPTVEVGRGLWGMRLTIFPRIPSTNRWMLDHAADCRHGDVVQALHQTAGQGRFDRVWHSEPGCALLLTVCLQPPVEQPHRLPQLAALTLCGLLETHKLPAKVKWPNDVRVQDRKIAGILVEQAASGMLAMGIGLNVNTSPAQLKQAGLRSLATSMSAAAGSEFQINALRDALLRALEHTLNLSTIERTKWINREWRPRDALRGRTIDVHGNADTIRGRYLGIDGQGRLRLVDALGAEHTFWSGDVTVRHIARDKCN